MTNGTKHDHGKTPWSMLPWPQIEQVVLVLEYGARKYGSDNNWRQVPNKRPRYFSAAQRHQLAWWQGEDTDKESGLPHLAHAIVSLLFLMQEGQQDTTSIDRLRVQNAELCTEIERLKSAWAASDRRLDASISRAAELLTQCQQQGMLPPELRRGIREWETK